MESTAGSASKDIIKQTTQCPTVKLQQTGMRRNIKNAGIMPEMNAESLVLKAVAEAKNYVQVNSNTYKNNYN